MNLVIDEGNTRTKIALFEGDELKDLQIHPHPLLDLDLDALLSVNTNNCIISSVKKPKADFNQFLSQFKFGIYLDHMTPLPIENHYLSKETLGRDRIAVAVGAWDNSPGKNILVIDSGTAITYEYISESGAYLGGTISPGLNMRFNSLNKGTSLLPKVVPEGAIGRIGKTTEEAIRNGVVNGMIHEIDGIISEFCNLFKNTSVLATGGNIYFFDKKLKSSIFVLPNLVLLGLNRILLYNVKK